MIHPQTDKEAIEEGLSFMPKFDDQGLIPAMAIDAQSKEPLMLAYMNQESLQQTLEKQEAGLITIEGTLEILNRDL